MVPYWILYLCISASSTFYWLAWKRKHFFGVGLWMLACLIGISLFVGFQPRGASRDYFMYEEWAKKAISHGEYSESWIWEKDPLFFLVSNVASFFAGGIALVIICYAVFSTWGNFAFFRHFGSKFPLMFFLYFSRYFLTHDFTQVRNTLAIALGSLGVLKVWKKEYFAGLGMLCLSCLAHLSGGIFIILLIPSLLIPCRPRRYGLFFSLSFIIVYFFPFSDPWDLSEISRIQPYITGDYQVTSINLIEPFFLGTCILHLGYLVRQFFSIPNGKANIHQREIAFLSATGVFFRVFFRENDAIGLRLDDCFAVFHISFLVQITALLPGSIKAVAQFLLLPLGLACFLVSTKIVFSYSLP